MPVASSEIDWDLLIEEGSHVMAPKGPALLLAALSRSQNPVTERDREQHRQAHDADLGAIYQHRHYRHSLSNEDREIWIDRLAWLLRTLESCQQERPNHAILIAMLRVASAFSNETRIWERLPSKYFSDNLFAGMAALIGSTTYSFSTRGRAEPIWEREAVDQFLEADKERDWLKIESLWRTIVPAIWPDSDLVEAAACLCASEKGRHALAMAFDACSSILPIACTASALSADQLGDVAAHLKSDRARFTVVQSLASSSNRNEPLPDSTLESLENLFRQVQHSIDDWTKWMRTFNLYPVRTKSLQPAFGKSLAGSDPSAKTAYIDAISLRVTHGECREAVAACLSEFRKAASLEERQVMWQLAFQRWEAWDFDIACSDVPLTRIAVCELDFGLIGYAVECLKDADLQTMLRTLQAELNGVQSRWYRDRLAFDAAWYRALSRWQIFTYAARVRAGEYEWDAPLKLLMPFDPAAHRYLAMSLGTNLP